MENSKVYQSHITTWIIITSINKKFTGFVCFFMISDSYLKAATNKKHHSFRKNQIRALHKKHS